MNIRRLAIAAFVAAMTTLGFSQNQASNTWLYVGSNQGWPQDRPGRMIFAAHVPPANTAMGNRGRIVFFGRSENGGDPVQPHRWLPPMYWESDFGTFDRTNTVNYELFCCGITLMMDGKIATAGSNFVNHVPNERTAVYDPATNLWTESPEPYWMHKARYYPTLTRMPSGKIVVSGGQANDNDPNTWWITDLPYEANPSVTNLQAPWVAPGSFDYDLENYPFMYPVSASELFFAGGERREQNGVHDKYLTFVFDTSATSLGDGRSPLGGYSETWHGTPIMYRPGLILKTGGVEDIGGDFNVDDKVATTHTEKVDVSSLTQPTQWQYAASMHHERIDHDLCTLADGRVMAMGGTLYHGKALRENTAKLDRVRRDLGPSDEYLDGRGADRSAGRA